MLVALPLFIFNIDFPSVIDNTLGLLAKMVTPMCMFILGIRLGVSNIKSLLTRPFVYITCLLKLVVFFPLFAYLCVYFIPGLSDMFKISVFVLSAAPTGAIIVSLAEMYGLEQELSANVVLLTTILSIITLPLLFINNLMW
ncbi:MAG: AEC family transporter [Clostridium sp.]|nr:MAG: AEC family transporter [Clostridium sp.]